MFQRRRRQQQQHQHQHQHQHQVTSSNNSDKNTIEIMNTTTVSTTNLNPDCSSLISRNRTTTNSTTTTTTPHYNSINATTGTTNNNNNKISSQSYYSEYHGHKVQHLTKIVQEFENQQQSQQLQQLLQQQQSIVSAASLPLSVTDTNTASTSTSTSTNSSTIRNYSKNNRIIWTAGDSSLDNKYWFNNTIPAINDSIHNNILIPSIMKPDITYWLNYYLIEQQYTQQTNTTNATTTTNSINNSIVINTAVEATTINERTYTLREQDIFIQTNLCTNDIVIVSIGGNDIALAPTPCTIVSIVSLIYCIPTYFIRNPILFKCCFTTNTTNSNTTTNNSCTNYNPCISIINNDDYCYGCCTSTISCCTMFPFCLGYFKHLLGIRIGHYITKLLTNKEKQTNTTTTITLPDQILICTIYYPDTNTNVQSWANCALSILQYNTNPYKLQLLINTIYQLVTSDIRLSINTTNTTSTNTNNRPTIVTAVPLFVILDGTNTNDYIHRVEPSIQGSKKIAQYLMDIINDNDNQRITNIQLQELQQGQQQQHFYYNNCNNISLELPQSNMMTDR